MRLAWIGRRGGCLRALGLGSGSFELPPPFHADFSITWDQVKAGMLELNAIRTPRPFIVAWFFFLVAPAFPIASAFELQLGRKTLWYSATAAWVLLGICTLVIVSYIWLHHYLQRVEKLCRRLSRRYEKWNAKFVLERRHWCSPFICSADVFLGGLLVHRFYIHVVGLDEVLPFEPLPLPP